MEGPQRAFCATSVCNQVLRAASADSPRPCTSLQAPVSKAGRRRAASWPARSGRVEMDNDCISRGNKLHDEMCRNIQMVIGNAVAQKMLWRSFVNVTCYAEFWLDGSPRTRGTVLVGSLGMASWVLDLPTRYRPSRARTATAVKLTSGQALSLTMDIHGCNHVAQWWTIIEALDWCGCFEQATRSSSLYSCT